MTYKGYLVEEIDGSYVGSVKDIDIPKINDGNVLIKVNFSSLNYNAISEANIRRSSLS